MAAAPSWRAQLAAAVHAPSFIPDATRGHFDRAFDALCAPAEVGRPWSLTDLAPLPVSGQSDAADAALARGCVSDLRQLDAHNYSGHFSTLLRSEWAASREASARNDLHNVTLDVQVVSRGRGWRQGEYELLADLDLPGLLEGRPHLEIGSIVRLRPEAGQHLIFRPFEIEAVVRAVIPTRGRATLSLPAYAASRACIECADEARSMGPAAWDSPLPPPSHTYSCGHFVVCHVHALAEPKPGWPKTCPLCGMTSPVRNAKVTLGSDRLPAHLAGAATHTLSGLWLTRAAGGGGAAPAVPAFEHLKSSPRSLAFETWLELLRSTSWRLRFEEDRAFGLLLAMQRANRVALLPASEVGMPATMEMPVFMLKLRERLSMGLGPFLHVAASHAMFLEAISSRFDNLPSRLFPTIEGALAFHSDLAGGAQRTDCILFSVVALAALSHVLQADCGPRMDPSAVKRRLVELEAQEHCVAESSPLDRGAVYAAVTGSLAAGPARDATVFHMRQLVRPVRSFFDERLNTAQREFTNAFVHGAHGRVPYLLTGPAGCGKTHSLAEVISQLLTRAAVGPDRLGGGLGAQSHGRYGRILLVGPSDEAVDVVMSLWVRKEGRAMQQAEGCAGIACVPASRLDTTEMEAAAVRLNSPSRPLATFANRPELLPYALTAADSSNTPGIESFIFPPEAVLRRCLLVACTLDVASLLPSLGLGRGSFSHIIVDEASQAMETSTLAAIELAGPCTRVCLAGDPRQLGPHVWGPGAREYGLAVSLQERLGAGTWTGAALASQEAQSASAHMGDSLYRGRSRSVYTDYRSELRSGEWLVRRGEQRWIHAPAPAPAPPVLPRAVGAALPSSLAAAVPAPAPYAPDPIDSLFETVLTVNYRSHQQLLDLPSRLFYSRSPLVSHAPTARASACLGFSLLEAAGVAGPFPMLVVGVDGEVEDASMGGGGLQSADPGGSYFNVAECEAVAWLIRALLNESELSAGAYPFEPRMLFRSSTGLIQQFPPNEPVERARGTPPFSPSQLDIAVLCPYRRQVLEMRKVLRAAGLNDINVGEPFNLQGADKPIIIVSTVLSKAFGASLLAHHKARGSRVTHGNSKLGLLLNDPSFNVAITRPEALLIAVGHAPTWVAEGGNWLELMRTAAAHGSFVGMGSGTHCAVRLPTLPGPSAPLFSPTSRDALQRREEGGPGEALLPEDLLGGGA
jgi:hypothetical protein